MTGWLMRAPLAPFLLEGFHIFQLTGSPVPALVAVAGPLLRRRRAKG